MGGLPHPSKQPSRRRPTVSKPRHGGGVLQLTRKGSNWPPWKPRTPVLTEAPMYTNTNTSATLDSSLK
jgi:hypothetical protein